MFKSGKKKKRFRCYVFGVEHHMICYEKEVWGGGVPKGVRGLKI